LNNKIISSTKINTIFLAISLVAGTIAGILSPSSFIIGVEAQSETEYGYNNSYEPTAYPDNNNYHKLKDSVSIEKIRCNNININFIGNNTGNLTLGNNGRLTPTAATGAEDDLSANSFGGSGYDDETNYGYDEGYNNNNPNIGIECIINNNNNNTNFDDSNETEPKPTCETCFSILNDADREGFLDIVEAILGMEIEINTIEDLCEFLETSTAMSPQDKAALLSTSLNSESVPDGDITTILICLENLGIIEVV
jgi:hypothetical protein